MSKLKALASIRSASPESFVYVPPDAAFGAGRILVKPNLGYPVKAPATVSLPVLSAVLRGLRRASPTARILIAEGVTVAQSADEVFAKLGLPALLDEEMRAADVEILPTRLYQNRLPQPRKYRSMSAPAYLAEFDCVISVAPFKRTQLNGQPLISASLKNLYGLFPRSLYHGRSPHARGQLHQPSVADVLQDIYFCIGEHIDGAVVDLTHMYDSPDWRPDRQRGVAHPVGKVIWGDDPVAVDETACRAAGVPIPDYLTAIHAQRRALGLE